MVARRWVDGVECPRCNSKNVLFLEKYNRWHCREKHSAPQFTLKTGTIFEDSAIGLDKWLTAMWMIVNSKNGVSSWEIHRALKVTQKTAWFMLHRIRLALQDQQQGKFGGSGSEVEADETFVGQKSQNMHKSRKLRFQRLRNEFADKNTPTNSRYYGKTAVMGVLDREQRKVRATVVPNTKRETLQNIIFKQIEHGSKLYTDQMVSYDKLAEKYAREVVNHWKATFRDVFTRTEWRTFGVY